MVVNNLNPRGDDGVIPATFWRGCAYVYYGIWRELVHAEWEFGRRVKDCGIMISAWGVGWGLRVQVCVPWILDIAVRVTLREGCMGKPYEYPEDVA